MYSLHLTLGYSMVQKSTLKRRTLRRAPFLSGNCSLKLVTTMMREMINQSCFQYYCFGTSMFCTKIIMNRFHVNSHVLKIEIK